MKRTLAVAILAFLTTVLAAPCMAQQGVNRPGGDYRNFELANTNPAACQAQCDSEAQCVSWTYVKPGLQGPQARCWLKASAPVPRADTCCTSGLRAAPVPPGMEVNINRPGGDYRDFNLTAADPKACQAQCQQEGQCRAWTYVRPGLQSPTARCWLKTTVPNAQPNDCCVSGVTTATQLQPPQANACEAACIQYCRAKGRPGGNFRGGICLLGVRTDDSVCGCQ